MLKKRVKLLSKVYTQDFAIVQNKNHNSSSVFCINHQRKFNLNNKKQQRSNHLIKINSFNFSYKDFCYDEDYKTVKNIKEQRQLFYGRDRPQLNLDIGMTKEEKYQMLNREQSQGSLGDKVRQVQWNKSKKNRP